MLAYIIGIMNMILHGIEAPNIIHTNTLSLRSPKTILKEMKALDEEAENVRKKICKILEIDI